MHPAFPKSLLPDNFLPGCSIMTASDATSRIKLLHPRRWESCKGYVGKLRRMEGANRFGWRIEDRVADKDFASDPLFSE